jgi:hypothetical protein
VLRSRREPVTVPDGRPPARSLRLLTRTTLRRETPALRAALLGRDARLAEDDRRLAAYQSAGAAPRPASSAAGPAGPAVFSIRPAPGTPYVSRLATDGKLLAAAFEAGRAAARAAFA